MLALPVILFALVRWAADGWRGTTRVSPGVNWLATTGVVVALVVFTVLRNLPQFHWLAP